VLTVDRRWRKKDVIPKKLAEVVTPLPFGRIKIYLLNGRWVHGPAGALDCRALRIW
jgi:hypothetical protein